MSKICWAGPKNFGLDQNPLDMDQKAIFSSEKVYSISKGKVNLIHIMN